MTNMKLIMTMIEANINDIEDENYRKVEEANLLTRNILLDWRKHAFPIYMIMDWLFAILNYKRRNQSSSYKEETIEILKESIYDIDLFICSQLNIKIKSLKIQ